LASLRESSFVITTFSGCCLAASLVLLLQAKSKNAITIIEIICFIFLKFKIGVGFANPKS
jgi:hypothetical protein